MSFWEAETSVLEQLLAPALVAATFLLHIAVLVVLPIFSNFYST